MFGMKRLLKDMNNALNESNNFSEDECARKLYKSFDRFADANIIVGAVTQAVLSLGLYYGIGYIEQKIKEREKNKKIEGSDK